jgi:hypothetical protein
VRRRAIICALLLIVGGVVLGATVFRTDIAQATGLAQSVTVDNTAANPVPVREQGTTNVNVVNSTVPVTVAGDDSARQHQECEAVVLPDGSSSVTGLLAPVPSGKRFVVKYVSVRATLPSGQNGVFIGLGLRMGSAPPLQVNIPLTRQGVLGLGGVDVYVGSESILGYQDTGSPRATVNFFRNLLAGIGFATFCVSGYLIDAP